MSVLAHLAPLAQAQLTASLIAAAGGILAACVGVYGLARAQSYAQLLRDIRQALEEVLDKQLAAEQRGPTIARYVEATMRRVIKEILGDSRHARRWYDR